MTLDPKALEAAAQAIAKTGMTAKGIAEFNWEEDFAYSERHEFMVQAEAALQTAFDAADLVPRNELEEREDQFDGLLSERFDAELEADTWRQNYNAARKHIAALRNALETAKAELSHDVPSACWATGPLTGDPIADLIVCPGCAALWEIRDVLADTAEAAAQYQRVPKNCIIVHSDYREAAESGIGLARLLLQQGDADAALVRLDHYVEMMEKADKAMNAAAPQAGEGTEEEDNELFPSRPFAPEDEIDG